MPEELLAAHSSNPITLPLAIGSHYFRILSHQLSGVCGTWDYYTRLWITKLLGSAKYLVNTRRRKVTFFLNHYLKIWFLFKIQMGGEKDFFLSNEKYIKIL